MEDLLTGRTIICGSEENLLNCIGLSNGNLSHLHPADERMFLGAVAVEEAVGDEEEKGDGSVGIEY